MKKQILRNLGTGFVLLLAGLATGPLTNILFPTTRSEYNNPDLFRPWNEPLMNLYFLHPFIVAVLLTWIWNRTHHLFPAKNPWHKGMQFGFLYWITTLPGMIMSYSSFPVSFKMILSWTLSLCVQAICAGLFLASTHTPAAIQPKQKRSR